MSVVEAREADRDVAMETEVILEASPPPGVHFSLSLVEMEVLIVVLGLGAPRVTVWVSGFTVAAASRLA